MTPPRPDPRPAREPKAVEAWSVAVDGKLSFEFFEDRADAEEEARLWRISDRDAYPIRVRIVPVNRRPRAGGKRRRAKR